tara:strand:+ start:58 stop:312 length:255 start_codon:yes stop_codon:yes gene_type:complete
MDPIYSSIRSHHTVSQINNVTGICDFSLIIIPVAFIACWSVCILYNAIFSNRKKNPSEILIYSLPMGLIVAIAGFLYLSQTYSC